MTVDPNPHAHRRRTIGFVSGDQLHVVDDEEIETAVDVVVEPAAGDAPLPAGDARSLGDVLEAAVAAVA